ncbi:MAG: cysteine desulfurase family protein [Phycisphaerae bacterium]|nr:cysteine desulfurase family protein [Phycisphaerae bacterium]
MDSCYLDNNATTQPLPEVVEAMRLCLERDWANPSSVHRAGVEARRRVELARESVARLIGCQEREVIFCSGGTEAANHAILGTLGASVDALLSGPAGQGGGGAAHRSREAQAARPASTARSSTAATTPSDRAAPPVLITSRLEHSAVRETAELWAHRGGDVVWARHDVAGVVDLDWLRSTLAERAGRIALVSLMWANNETGVVQPIARIGALCREHGVRFHTDATQWVGKMETDVAALQVDLLSFAAHKFHGPKGIGALYVRRGIRLERQLIGGPQERDRRGGTENVPGIVGMGVAADAARAWLATDERTSIAAERDRLERAILSRCESATVNGLSPAQMDSAARHEQPDIVAPPRLWNTTNIGFRRLEAEAILLLLSERGICASAGAACSSGSLDPSPVLLAMGIPPEIAHGSIRLSLSRFTTTAEVDRAIEEIPQCIAKLLRGMAAV